MVGTQTDMTEHPNDILRALADPDRLRIAGALAASEAVATALAEPSAGVSWTRDPSTARPAPTGEGAVV